LKTEGRHEIQKTVSPAGTTETTVLPCTCSTEEITQCPEVTCETAVTCPEVTGTWDELLYMDFWNTINKSILNKISISCSDSLRYVSSVCSLGQNVDPYRKHSLMASVKTKFILSYRIEKSGSNTCNIHIPY
jgi:hypothetical protein